MFHPTHLFASLFLLCIAFGRPAGAQSLVQEGPPLSQQFGHSITVLPNGNYIVTDPQWDNGKGAVYLYNGMSHALISTLAGSAAGDFVGNGGVTVLAGGHFVISSINWKNGTYANAGAVTWGHKDLGVSGAVSTGNSLAGGSANDSLGSNGIRPLPNGNYVVISSAWNTTDAAKAGAVTFGKGSEPTVGVVTAANSLTGMSANDRIGSRGILILSNGNYVVVSPSWTNAGKARACAVTWGSKNTGVLGPVSAGNSLLGTTASDSVGSGSVVALSNGNYVVASPAWNKSTTTKAGAVTWCDGTTGRTGQVTAGNSLTGSRMNDRISSGGVYAVKDGNFVVSSPQWYHGTIAMAGAVTFASGSSEITGVPTTANSLTGSNPADAVGSGGITVLTNGHYVVNSMNWKNGSVAKAGAVTWGNGTTGVKGAISSLNSLVGSITNDSVGSGGVLALANGNYVVSSLVWDHAGSIVNAGAVTWANGNSGITGSVNSANSMLGAQSHGRIGHGGMVALSNGNYLFMSPFWHNGPTTNAGAVT